MVEYLFKSFLSIFHPLTASDIFFYLGSLYLIGKFLSWLFNKIFGR